MPILDHTINNTILDDISKYRQQPDKTLDYFWKLFKADLPRSNVAVVDHQSESRQVFVISSTDNPSDKGLVHLSRHIHTQQDKHSHYPNLKFILQFISQEIFSYPYIELLYNQLLEFTLKHRVNISAPTARACYYIHLLRNGNILIRAEIRAKQMLVGLNPEQELFDTDVMTFDCQDKESEKRIDNKFSIEILITPNSQYKVIKIQIPDTSLFYIDLPQLRQPIDLLPDTQVKINFNFFQEVLEQYHKLQELSRPKPLLSSTASPYLSAKTTLITKQPISLVPQIADALSTAPMSIAHPVRHPETHLEKEIAEFIKLAEPKIVTTIPWVLLEEDLYRSPVGLFILLLRNISALGSHLLTSPRSHSVTHSYTVGASTTTNISEEYIDQASVETLEQRSFHGFELI